MRNIFSEITRRTMGQNRTRTVVTIIGVILSTAMVTALAVFAGSMQHFLVQHTIATEGAWHVDISGMTREELAEVLADDRVEKASVLYELGYVPAREEDGICHLVASRDETAWEELPVELDAGRLPETEDEILIPYDGIWIAGQEAHVGDVLAIPMGRYVSETGETQKSWELVRETSEEAGRAGQYVEGQTRSFTVTGVYKEMAEMDFGSARFDAGYMLLTGGRDIPDQDENGLYCRAFLEMKKPGQADGFIADWVDPSDGRNRLEGVSWSRHDSLLRWQGVFRSERYIQFIVGMLGILLAVIMVGSVSLIYNSFSISLRERTAQFGLLASVGATRKQLRKSLRFEAFLVSGLGIPLGLLAGVAGSAVTLHFIGGGLTAFMYGYEGEIPVQIYPAALLLAAAFAFLIVLVSVWIPSRRIRKISPMDAIRSTKDIRIRPRDVKSGRLTGKMLGLPGMLASKNYRRDRKKYKSTVVSLTVSMVLLMTAALFTIYLTRAGGTILDPPKYELEYTLFLSGGQEDEQTTGDVRKLLENEPGVEGVWMYKSIYLSIPVEENMLNEEYSRVNSWSGEDHPDGKVPFTCPAIVLSDDEYQEFLKEQGLEEPDVGAAADGADGTDGTVLKAVYYDQMQVYDEENETYSQVPVLSDEVKKRPLAAGIYRAEETPDGGQEVTFEEKLQVEFDQETMQLPEKYDAQGRVDPIMILSERQFEQYRSLMSDGTEGESYFAEFNIRASDYRTVGADLQEKLEEKEEWDGIFYTPAADAEMNRQSVAAIQVLCYGFITLISLIALVNVFNTMSTNLMLRRREFAMLRSVGMTGRSFRLMLGYECVIYGLRSLVYGTILSLLISFAFWHFTSRAGGGNEFIFPWPWFAAAVAGVLLIVGITMAYSIGKIRRMNIIDELRKE